MMYAVFTTQTFQIKNLVNVANEGKLSDRIDDVN